jgi:hypothetical protein
MLSKWLEAGLRRFDSSPYSFSRIEGWKGPPGQLFPHNNHFFFDRPGFDSGKDEFFFFQRVSLRILFLLPGKDTMFVGFDHPPTRLRARGEGIESVRKTNVGVGDQC